MPKISIIVPIYNVEKYLKRCIDSILNQTFKDFELILVDDDSPDKCGEICNEYAKSDNRIKVIHKKNGGLSSARNAGIDISKGEYIGFVDSDDYIHPKMYELLYKNIIDYSADIAICKFEKVSGYKVLYEDIKANDFHIKEFNSIQALNEIYKDNNVHFITAWSKLYKRYLFEDLRFFEGKIHEDEFIVHEILYKSKKIISLPFPLYKYYQASNSIMRNKFTIKRLDAVYAYKDRVDFFRKINEKELQYKAEYFFIEYFLKFYFRSVEELGISYKELNNFKRIFIGDLSNLLKNPNYNWKEKIIWIIFAINSNLYKKLINKIS